MACTDARSAGWVLPAWRIGSALLADQYVELLPRNAVEYAGLFEHAG
jgi:hypothetical protein